MPHVPFFFFLTILHRYAPWVTTTVFNTPIMTHIFKHTLYYDLLSLLFLKYT